MSDECASATWRLSLYSGAQRCSSTKRTLIAALASGRSALPSHPQPGANMSARGSTPRHAAPCARSPVSLVFRQRARRSDITQL